MDPTRVSVSTPNPAPSKVTVAAAAPVDVTPPTVTLTPASVWTTLAEDIGRAPDELQDQRNRYVCWGRLPQWANAANGAVDLDAEEFDPPDGWIPPNPSPTYETASYAIFDADTLSGTRRFWRSSTGNASSAAPWDEPVRWETLGGAVTFEVPWGPTVKGPPGTTDQFILIDYDDGGGWEIQGGRPSNWYDRLLINLRPKIPRQSTSYDWVCDAAARRTPQNAFTYTRRGMGRVPQRVGITTAAEVIAARNDGHSGVGHALAVIGVMMETGPLAEALSPATRVEMPAANNTMLSTHPNAPHSRLTKQGLRLASDLTESEIDSLLAALYPTDVAWRRTVKVWWMTVSEEGFVVGATTGRVETSIETSTMSAGFPDSALWASIGHTSAARNRTVWNGYPWNRLYVVAPAP